VKLKNTLTGRVSAEYSFQIQVRSVVDAVLDVQPTSDDNIIKVNSTGNVPIALLSTQKSHGEADTLDATKTVLASIHLNGKSIQPVSYSYVDVDHDGDLDLLMQFSIPQLFSKGVLDPNDVDQYVQLTAEFVGGVAIDYDLIASDRVKLNRKK
ncbi:MAG TPA: hypothetical protein PLV92_27120, partial [Pirellulaceae bacterium]|nr:hypothetical protein [Pirellulaceae bacterium]